MKAKRCGTASKNNAYDTGFSKTIIKLTGFIFFLLIWQAVSSKNDSLILPSPMETAHRLYEILITGQSYQHIGMTVLRALAGFVMSAVIGMSLGIVAGVYKPIAHFMYPCERIMISVPPIAWLVLTIIWFGGTGLLSATSTIFISCFPLIYLNTVQGVRTIDDKLLEMGQSFGMLYRHALFKIGGMHIASSVVPSLAIAFGTSWKVGVMAEVLGTSNGIGSQVAKARVNLETTDVFAWIAIAVLLYVIVDRVFIEPINSYTMKWR